MHRNSSQAIKTLYTSVCTPLPRTRVRRPPPLLELRSRGVHVDAHLPQGAGTDVRVLTRARAGVRREGVPPAAREPPLPRGARSSEHRSGDPWSSR